MSLSRPLLLAAFVGAAGFVSADAAAERPAQIDTTRSDQVQFEHQFSRGQSQTFTLAVEQSAEGLAGTDGYQRTITGTSTIRYEVQSVDDDSVAEIAVSVGVPQIEVLVDGEYEATRPYVENFESARYSFRMAPTGAVVDSTGGVPKPDETEASFSELIEDLNSLTWPEFPDQPVAIGDSWLHSSAMAIGKGIAGLQASVHTRYTLTGYAMVNGAEHAVIDAEHSVDISGETMVGSTGVRSVEVIGRGSGNGYVLFNQASGTVSEAFVDNGVVIAITESNGQRSTTAIEYEATIRRAGSPAGAQAATP